MDSTMTYSQCAFFKLRNSCHPMCIHVKNREQTSGTTNTIILLSNLHMYAHGMVAVSKLKYTVNIFW